MNKNVKMSKSIPQNRSARYFRGPALCQGLENPMKLVDGMGIDAENMSSVNPQRSVHSETWCRTGQFSRTRYVTEKKGCRSDILLAFLIILLLRRRASHIPQPALVSGEGSVVPHVVKDATGKISGQSARTSNGRRGTERDETHL